MSQSPYIGNVPLHSSPTPSTINHHYSWQRSLVDVGIFRDTILPSLTIHGSMALIAYGVGRVNNSVETKDMLWPLAPLINGWWSAIGRRVFVRGLSLSQALGALSRPERLILTGVTLWGGRLFYRIATRSAKRGKGQDDPRYDELKEEENFWNKALFTTYLPEALFQTIITLPLTAPFHHQGAALSGYHPFIQALAVGVFSAGFALEVLADGQLDKFKEDEDNSTKICREGVWSIVRHPNYLGDALIHFSFPLLLYGSDMLAPIEILGSVVNYFYLRQYGGTKKKEASQERRYSVASMDKHADLQKYREEKNSFWPDLAVEAGNKWLWTVVGAGVGGALIEQAFHQLI